MVELWGYVKGVVLWSEWEMYDDIVCIYDFYEGWQWDIFWQVGCF